MDNNISTIKKNNNIQVDCSQELAPEVHAKHTKYIFMSWHVNVKEKTIKCRHSEYILRSLETNKPTKPMEKSPSWRAKSSSAGQKIPSFYTTQSLFILFKRARHFSASWARRIQSTLFHTVNTEALKGFMSVYTYRKEGIEKRGRNSCK
jgi:hypothetical protein